MYIYMCYRCIEPLRIYLLYIHTYINILNKNTTTKYEEYMNQGTLGAPNCRSLHTSSSIGIMSTDLYSMFMVFDTKILLKGTMYDGASGVVFAYRQHT